MLDGVFAFVLYDTRNKTYMAARDAIGVNPLYIGWGGDGRRPPPHLSAGSPCAARSRFCPRRPACARPDSDKAWQAARHRQGSRTRRYG